VKLDWVFQFIRPTNPTELVKNPLAGAGGTGFYVLEQAGRMLMVEANATAASVAIDLTGRVTNDGEAGLLGLAFHPSFATKRFAYVYYTIVPPAPIPGVYHQSIVSRFAVRPDGTLDPATEKELLRIDQPSDLHKGGKLAFGPDGFLYVSIGDGATDANVAQDKTKILGKILRLDVDGGSPYAIPPSNPFSGPGERREIYALGFRNPWRFSFDAQSGDLWVGDVGQSAWEEIDKVELGGNYGWPIREGAHCFGVPTCDAAGLVDPVVEHANSEAVAIIGGVVYHGTQLPNLAGKLVYGSYGGSFYALEFDPTTGAPKPVLLNPNDTAFHPSAIAEGTDGEIYFADVAQNAIFAIHPASAGPPSPSPLPRTLSKTGCVDPSNPRLPAKGMIPYAVNAELWSDGAAKTRALAIPDGTTIALREDGDFDLPPRSVAMKTFLIEGKPVETRLLVRHDDGGWGGFSYAWNDAGTDADLLDGNRTKDLGGGKSWYFPSRAECLRCHTDAAGRSLGLEIAQLDRDFEYPNGAIVNQMANLDHVGLFDKPPFAVPHLVDPSKNGDADARARSYLHANCSFCHRPGTGILSMDMRVTAPLEPLCDAPPKEGDRGVAGAKILAPSAPEKSVLSLRMHRTGAGRMPPVASRVVDGAGTKTIDDWIRTSACR
jgi:uncharacterized repeat protein (TIGR03806 family)